MAQSPRKRDTKKTAPEGAMLCGADVGMPLKHDAEGCVCVENFIRIENRLTSAYEARAFGNIAALALFVELITSIAAIQLGSLFADRVAAMHRRP
jgi:hypothetical protein